MPAFTGALATFVAPRYGIVSDAQLRALGISARQRGALVAEGVLIWVFDGVYRVASTPESLEGRCLAICMACPHAVITGRAAGKLWGIRRMGRVDQIEVRVPHFAQSLTEPWVRLRRCNVMEEIDIVHRDDGIRVVSPPRLAFDVSSILGDLDLESVIEQLLDRQMCTMPTLHDTARRLCHRARPGSARFARIVSTRPAWLKPADSHLEVLVFDRLRRVGLQGLVRQFSITLPTGIAVHPDIAVPEISWAIEIDHVTWHGGRVATQADKVRDRQLRQIDWHVDRVTDCEITSDLDGTIDQLLEIHRRLRQGPRLDRRRSS